MLDLQNSQESFKDGLVFNIYVFIILAFLLGFSVQFFVKHASIYPTILFNFLVGSIGYIIVKDRIKNCIDIALETRRRELEEKYNTGRNQKIQILDFQSLVAESLGWGKTSIKYLLEADESLENIIDKLKENTKKIKYSQEALNGLLFSKKRESQEDYLLEAIAISALEKTGIYKGQPNFQKKYKHLYAYLRGWLICSIRYNTDSLPIKLIKDTALSKQEQIDAIFYIRNDLIEHKKVQEHIPSKKSREIICQYLKKLELQIKKEI